MESNWRERLRTKLAEEAALPFEELVRRRQTTYNAWMIYATRGTAEVVYLSVSYNHSTRPTFGYLEVNFETKRESYRYGHPKRAGITAREGWKLHDDCKGAEW